MNFLHCIFAVLMMLAPFFVTAKELFVPGPGSVWVYRMYYAATEGTSGQHNVFVKDMRYGRPVFSAHLGGREFSIFEENDHVTLLEKECGVGYEVAPAYIAPNTCGWVPCTVLVGETIEHKLVAVTTLTQCTKASGSARFTGLNAGTTNVLGNPTLSVKTEAHIKIPGMGAVTWYPHVSPGRGEVFAESQAGERRAMTKSM